MTGRPDYLTSERPPLQETGGIAYTAGIMLMALMLGVMYLVLDLIGNQPHSLQVSSAPISEELPSSPHYIPRGVAKEKDKRASQHIEAQPDELEKVGHCVRHLEIPDYWNMDPGQSVGSLWPRFRVVLSFCPTPSFGGARF